jgi:hypothetical protein
MMRSLRKRRKISMLNHRCQKTSRSTLKERRNRITPRFKRRLERSLLSSHLPSLGRKEPLVSFREKKDRNADATIIPREAAVVDTEDAVATEVDINSHSEVVKSGKTVLKTTTEAIGTMVVKHSNKKEVKRALLQSLEMIRTLTALSIW